MLKRLVKNFLKKQGYEITNISRRSEYPLYAMETSFPAIASKCKYLILGDWHKMFSVYSTVNYISEYGIPGDLVECGVYKGGMTKLMAYTLLENNCKRKIYLYDTFKGHVVEPTGLDINYTGALAMERYKNAGGWCSAGLDEVKNNMFSTGYSKENIVFVEGEVNKTIPDTIPEKISLLRIDVDLYEATLHILEHLFPRLSKNGVLIIAAYGHWKGTKTAIDKYFKENNILMFRGRATGSMVGVKV
tara:strand:- start:680 stop:1417 length:738 start_codon:yes stop_codon:yes gene_type:complete